MPLPVRLKSIPLWDARWHRQALKDRHDDNPRAFERGFRLRAYSDAESTFPSFPNCRIPGVVLGDVMRNTRWPAFSAVDLSSKKRPGTVIITVKVDPKTRRRYPIDVRFGAWRASETCEQIRQVDEQFRPVVIMVEDNGFQETLIDWISDDKSRFPFWVKVEATTTTGGKKSHLERGLPGLEVEFKNRAWVFPLSEYEGATREDDPPRGHWARLDYEFRFHPIASSDDGVMACWMARQGIEIYGGLGIPSQSELGDVNVR